MSEEKKVCLKALKSFKHNNSNKLYSWSGRMIWNHWPKKHACKFISSITHINFFISYKMHRNIQWKDFTFPQGHSFQYGTVFIKNQKRCKCKVSMSAWELSQRLLSKVHQFGMTHETKSSTECYLHETAQHLFCILWCSWIGKADERTVDSNPGTPFQLLTNQNLQWQINPSSVSIQYYKHKDRIRKFDKLFTEVQEKKKILISRSTCLEVSRAGLRL